jgi:hypothetical protein
MLRNALLIGSGALFVLCLALTIVDVHLFMFALGAGVVFLATLFERIYYKRLQSKSPGPDWVRTTERFVDPQTGRRVTIYVHPTTGERAYVDD